MRRFLVTLLALVPYQGVETVSASTDNLSTGDSSTGNPATLSSPHMDGSAEDLESGNEHTSTATHTLEPTGGDIERSGHPDDGNGHGFQGFHLYTHATLSKIVLRHMPDHCKTALEAEIHCHPYVRSWTQPMYHGPLNNKTLTNEVCSQGCGNSLASYFRDVAHNCSSVHAFGGHVPELLGGRLWAGYNETCLQDKHTGEYCNAVIANFTKVPNIHAMPDEEMCSHCFVERRAMMERTPFSIYNRQYKANLEAINERCNFSLPTAIPPPAIFTEPRPDPEFCVSGVHYNTSSSPPLSNDANPTAPGCCDDLALAYNLSTASIYTTNQEKLVDCSATRSLPANTSLCLPMSCRRTYVLQPNDTCLGIEANPRNGIGFDQLRDFNPWINAACTNLHQASKILGGVLCLTPQALIPKANKQDSGHDAKPGGNATTGEGDGRDPADEGDMFSVDSGGRFASIAAQNILSSSSSRADGTGGVVHYQVEPPADTPIASGTTRACGRWAVAGREEDGGISCAGMCVRWGITSKLLMEANPSLASAGKVGCDNALVAGRTYCVGPLAYGEDFEKL